MRRNALHAIFLTALVVLLGWAWIPTAHADDKPQQKAEDVQKWAVERMIAWAKPGISLLPAAQESFDDGKVRYGMIANAALRAASKNKSLFGGPTGRIKTAALLLSISMFESSYRKDVDMNIGKEGRGDGGRSWCMMQLQLGSPVYIDGAGKRVTLTQVCKDEVVSYSSTPQRRCTFVPPPGAIASTPSRIVFVGDGYEITSDQTKGHSGQDLIADRELCFSAGLRIVRNSFAACSKLPMLERLSAYASGNCEDGKEASRRRVGSAIRWLEQYPPPVNDVQLVALFSPPKTPETDVSAPTVTNSLGSPSPISSFDGLTRSQSIALLP